MTAFTRYHEESGERFQNKDSQTNPGANLTEGTAGWATFGCDASNFSNFGVRGQAKRYPALARSARSSGTVKAPSPLRSAGALQKSRVSPILRNPP